MDRLRCFRVLLEVSRCGSFHGAAEHLAMSRAAVTKHVAQLEQSLGVRLLNRTTRQVGLTPAGALAAERCRQMLDQYEAMEIDLRDSTRAPSGVVRVGTPPAFGTIHMVPLIERFTARHPDIRVVLVLDVGDASLIKRGLDLSIRISVDLVAASHVAIPLSSAPQVLVAAPSYLAARGTPATPEALGEHNCLIHSIKSPTGIWRLDGPGGVRSVRVGGNLASDFGEPLRAAALAGQGIAMHPYYMVQDDLLQGRLVAVLPEYALDQYDIHAIYSSRHGLTERARRFLGYLREWLRSPPPWSLPDPLELRGAAHAGRSSRVAAERAQERAPGRRAGRTDGRSRASRAAPAKSVGA
ncbi:MAG: LysR family transcriptional regulator [Lautropia sp.]